ncbi:MAG: type II toxin-antitoxin system HicB family antitoxin [Pyrinomonadaceae bacterium]
MRKCIILGKMITQYIQAAMRKAKYEILEGNEGFYGEIPGFDGVWSSAATLEDCRDELSDALETWLLFRVSRGLKVPNIGRHKLSVEFAAS